MPLHVSSTRGHRREVKIVLYSLWYHHTETSEWSKITKHKLRYVSTTDYLITIKVSHRQHVSTNQVVIIRAIT